MEGERTSSRPSEKARTCRHPPKIQNTRGATVSQFTTLTVNTKKMMTKEKG
jgi:hypothetical protein